MRKHFWAFQDLLKLDHLLKPFWGQTAGPLSESMGHGRTHSIAEARGVHVGTMDLVHLHPETNSEPTASSLAFGHFLTPKTSTLNKISTGNQ